MRNKLVLALGLLAATAMTAPASAQKVLKVVPHADLRVLDGYQTTATITAMHMASIYDALFAWDEKLEAKPDAVGNWSMSPDKLKYTYTLRDGLKFHDGSPVTAKDAVASVKRLMARETLGRTLQSFAASVDVVDDKTFTITLNGTAFVTASTGGALADVNATAEFIAEQGSLYTGWYSSVSPTSNGATVTFIQGTPGSTGGAFTMTSTGAATGTFATVQAGAANDSTTGFVAQTAWNVDRLNGSGGALNPSGILLDPAKLNVWEIVLGYLGASMIELRWMSPNGEFNAVHQIQYPNTATIPTFKNPCFRVGLVAASLGSTTALTAQSASAAAFIDGDVYTVRDPFTAKNFNYSASATEYVALALRVRGEFASVINLRQVFAITAMAACETANRLIAIRFVLNPTMTGTVNWGYVNQSLSCMEYATPTTIVASGGQEVASVITGTTAILDLQQLDLRLEPGDVLALAVATVTSTASAAVAVNWQER